MTNRSCIIAASIAPWIESSRESERREKWYLRYSARLAPSHQGSTGSLQFRAFSSSSVFRACRGRKKPSELRHRGGHGGGGSVCFGRGGEDGHGGGGGRERPQLLRAAVGASALLPARPAAPVPPRRRHRQAHRRIRRRPRRTRRRGRSAHRGGRPQEERHAGHRQGQGALRAGERRRVRGGGRRRQERALRGRREAPRRDARRRQPRLWRDQKGCSRERQ